MRTYAPAATAAVLEQLLAEPSHARGYVIFRSASAGRRPATAF